MESCQSTRNAIIAALPRLRAYAVILLGSKERADELIQQTLVRALLQVDSSPFETNTLASLITMLRSHVVSDYRKYCHELEERPSRTPCHSVQKVWTESHDFGKAVAALPLDQREAVVLVEGSGFTYDEAARICGCPSQTIKSRANRALNTLARSLPNQSAIFTTDLNSHAAAKPQELSLPNPLSLSFGAMKCTRRIST